LDARTELKESSSASVKQEHRRGTGQRGSERLLSRLQALEAVWEERGEASPTVRFSDGVVFLDPVHVTRQANGLEHACHKLAGAGFLERLLARDRATEACRARAYWLIIEGGEEADGKDGGASINELFSVLSPGTAGCC